MKIAVIDFSTSKVDSLTNILNRLKEKKIAYKVYKNDVNVEELKVFDGVILSGSADTVYLDGKKIDVNILKMNKPVLGICYGMQLIHYLLGGKIARAAEKESGSCKIKIKKGRLFEGLPIEQNVSMSHYDEVVELAEGFECCACTENCANAASENIKMKLYTVQFHPEREEGNDFGGEIIDNFLKECMNENVRREDFVRITNKELADKFIEEQVRKIKEQVGNKKVLLALSGGVDSSVVAALLIKAVGNQLTCVHVNHGLLRKGEPEQVIEIFKNQMKANLVYVDATDRFLLALKDVDDPETKRKIIGKIFIDVFEEEKSKLQDVSFLAQGTIYPDILESHGVKAHHNVGGLPEDLQFELVEPVKLLYKDEVRVVGEALGLPHNMVYRQPFPGPGLGVRCTGAITRDRLNALREADAIVREEIDKLEVTPWQYFAVIPDIQSTGVKDGKRYMGWPVIIRAVNTVDAVTAQSVMLPQETLITIRDRILAEVNGVNRVLWDYTDKPVSTIEWE